MRKTLCALGAACALTPQAQAQSSVTLFGILDVGVSYVSNENGSHNFKADDSIWTPSIWGIRGVEDLGGGYKTLFELASQFSVNSGAGIPGPNADFNRQAFVGLSKDDVGRITFGQQYNLMADFLFFPPAKPGRRLHLWRPIQHASGAVRRARHSPESDRLVRLRPDRRNVTRVELGQDRIGHLRRFAARRTCTASAIRPARFPRTTRSASA